MHLICLYFLLDSGLTYRVQWFVQINRRFFFVCVCWAHLICCLFLIYISLYTIQLKFPLTVRNVSLCLYCIVQQSTYLLVPMSMVV